MSGKTTLRFAIATAALVAAAAPAAAGPCTADIHKLQVAFDQRLDAAAAKGPGAAQSSEAKMHRQPTPKTLAQVEAKIGDISPDAARKFNEDMEQARKADDDNNVPGCASALADARAAIKP